MHIEVLVEDSSGAKLISILLPNLIGAEGAPHTWRIHEYRGVGRLPRDLNEGGDPAKRALLDQLPRLLRGYKRTPGIDAVLVVLDSDRRDCKSFLRELQSVAKKPDCHQNAIFQLATEEIEAWLLGDQQAILAAYPKAKKEILRGYQQDSICDTWEWLADAIYKGGSAALKKAQWPRPGHMKHEWVVNIAPHMNVEQNRSPSFVKFREGVVGLLPRSPLKNL